MKSDDQQRTRVRQINLVELSRILGEQSLEALRLHDQIEQGRMSDPTMMLAQIANLAADVLRRAREWATDNLPVNRAH